MSNTSRNSSSKQRANKLILSRTLALMVVCGVVAFVVLAVRLYQIQIVEHDYYESLAVEQQTRETTVTASRGTIYDRNMKVLAMSASVNTVYISPKEISMNGEDVELIASRLSQILDVDYDSIVKKAKDTSRWYETIKTKIEQDLADQVLEFINEYKLIGVKLEPDTKRYYPYSSLASHIIGFVGTDNTGLEGIESKYDKYLQGVNGSIVRLKNSAGSDMLFTKYENYYDAEDGNDVVLTIDSSIQYYLEKNLEQAVADYDVLKGAAGIVMDVNTGEILAMVSLGNYDLNNFLAVDEEIQAELDAIDDKEEYNSKLGEAQLKQWRNKALSDTYEPGSTFKIITLAMALEEGVVSLHDGFYCGGSVPVLGRTSPVNCWKHGGHGSQTLSEAVENSCNVAFVNIGLRVGAETFYKYAEAFGFFEKTGIELEEEGSIWWPESVFMDDENLSQLAAASFGQTFNITPIQLITAVSAVANGGYLMQPYMVKQALDSNGNVIMQNDPEVVRQVISEETSKTVREILESVVVKGTGKNAYIAGYRIAGKTGTSEKTADQAAAGEGAQKEYIVSFVGFAPADDPQVAVLVLLDTPSTETGIYISGGQMAAPTVGKIFADILPYIEVEAQYTDEELAVMDVAVPNVKNSAVETAKATLVEAGFTVRVVGSGDTVTDQVPYSNAVVSSGTEVVIYAGEKKPDMEVEVPNLSGMTFEQARTALNNAGLYMKTSGVSPGTSNAVVSKQSVDYGGLVSYGTVIEVTFIDNSDSSVFRT